MFRISVGAVLHACAIVFCSPSATAEPLDVAPGHDPGGRAVAVLTSPFDLSDARVSPKLARDGEGVAIGWDFSKPDSGEPTQGTPPTSSQPAVPPPDVATTLTTQAGVRLVPVFVDLGRTETFARAIAFSARTPAQIVVMPHATRSEADWHAFRAAAAHFSQLLFIVPANIISGDTTDPPFPAAFGLTNVLSVATARTTAAADVVVRHAPATGRPDLALALTVKSLLICGLGPTRHNQPLSKLDALAALGALGQTSEATPTRQGTLTFTPCDAALN